MVLMSTTDGSTWLYCALSVIIVQTLVLLFILSLEGLLVFVDAVDSHLYWMTWVWRSGNWEALVVCRVPCHCWPGLGLYKLYHYCTALIMYLY